MTIIADIQKYYVTEFERRDPVKQKHDFEKALLRNNVRTSGKLLPVYLEPYFIDARDRAHFEDITMKIMGVLEKITTAFHADTVVAQTLAIRGRINSYLNVDHGFQRSIVIARLDAFFDRVSRTLKLLEFNCDDPSGLGDNDAINTIFQKSDTMKALHAGYVLESDPLLDRFKDAALATYAEFCHSKGIPIKKNPVMVVACSRNSSMRTDVDRVVTCLKERGINAQYADPRFARHALRQDRAGW